MRQEQMIELRTYTTAEIAGMFGLKESYLKAKAVEKGPEVFQARPDGPLLKLKGA